MTSNALTVERLLKDPTLRKSLARWLSEPADADDVLQLVAEKVLRERVPLLNKGYLAAVLRNCAIDLQRAKLRRAANAKGLFVELGDSVAPAPDRALQVRQATDAIQAILDRQPPLSRKIFMLCHVQGMSQTKIATQLGVHQSTVEKRLAKVRKACLKELSAHLD